MRGKLERLLRAARAQLWGFLEWIVASLPGPLGIRLRYRYWKCRLRFLGKNVSFGIGVRIYAPEWVSIGDHCWIDDYVIIIAGPPSLEGRFVYRKQNPRFSFQEGEVVIGERVHISPFVILQGHGGLSIGNCLSVGGGAKIYSLSHHYRDLTGQGPPDTIWKGSGLASPQEQAMICAPTVIEDHGILAGNSIMLPGSTIGRNSWVGAMSFLQGQIPPDVIATGIPATVIKKRFE